ncbi:hypothetical protein PF001_g19395 [Phytophthora fragariae]|uniref:Uncharacterized protein n=1 Tax=Phytophthora fragariae TaxID=53985 RepID=A0A6A4CR72_9STRA|nr:hypothetical protein PF001_g19395 [Phytophthora fragariae]
MAISAVSWGRVTVGTGFPGGFCSVGTAGVSAREVRIIVVCISLMVDSSKALGITLSVGFATSVRADAADSCMASGGRFMGMRLGDSKLLSESTLDWIEVEARASSSTPGLVPPRDSACLGPSRNSSRLV